MISSPRLGRIERAICPADQQVDRVAGAKLRHAETGSDPQQRMIGQRHADEQERTLARTMMERDRKPEWSEAEFQARCEVVGLIFDGLLRRAVNHPDLDRDALTDVLRSTVRHLLS